MERLPTKAAELERSSGRGFLGQISTGESEFSTHEGGNFGSISATIGISELEQILIHKTFTRSEIQHLIALLHSRLMEEWPSDNVAVEREGAKPPSPAPVIRVEASSTSGSIKDINMETTGTPSMLLVSSVQECSILLLQLYLLYVVEEQIGSPELANAYKGSSIGTSQSPRQDSELTGLPKTLKASIEQPATMENLPDELLSNIFTRLLSKQIAQMRSVSKSLNGLLSQFSFVKSHLHRSIHNNDRLLLSFDDVTSTYTSTPFRTHTSPSSHPELTDSIKPTVNLRFEYADVIRVIGSINGLLCYSYNDSDIHIYNPSLSADLTLPSYSIPSYGYNAIRVYFRFVFDPQPVDYKVVKLTGLTGPPRSAVRWWLQIEIYSMRKGTWELITERFPAHITYIADGDFTCSDGHEGHLHWLCGIDRRSDSERIVAFDIGLETFREMLLPDCTLNHNYLNVLGILAGKLCLMSRHESDIIEVWVMEEYGVAESWVPRHVFSQFIEIGVFGFTSHNEFLVVSENYIVLYDLVADKETILEEVCSGSGGSDKIVEYVDSLVWVAPDKHQMVDAV